MESVLQRLVSAYCFHLQSFQSSLFVNMDLKRSRVSKEWMGANIAYLVLFCLQTSTSVSNLRRVHSTAKTPKEVMSVTVPKASGSLVASMEIGVKLMV